MDNLNRFMAREGIPSIMRTRVREYFHRAKHLRLSDTQKQLLSIMPPRLRGDVVVATNSGWLQGLPFLRAAPRAFLVDLAMELSAMVYAPGDIVQAGFLYIIHRGVALHRAKVMTKGGVIGVDIILANPHLQSHSEARAMNYLEVYLTTRDELVMIAERFPETLVTMRRFAAWLAGTPSSVS